MHIPVALFRRAIDIYLAAAYPAGVPAAQAERVAAFDAGGTDDEVPLALLEQDVADSAESWALRLGQPLYPHMKLVLDPVPGAGGAGGGVSCRGYDFLLRVDAHDRHLHAPPSSPDAAWLAGIRASNKALVEKIESDWAAAGLPTFKEYLRSQLEARRKAAAH